MARDHGDLEQLTTAAQVAGLGVNSDALGAGFEPALNLLASQGLVAGGTVEVGGLLGLYAAQGMATAVAEAQRNEWITGSLERNSFRGAP
jgi:hypothetical protein